MVNKNLTPSPKITPLEPIEVEAEEILHDETGMMVIPEFKANGLDKTDAQKTLDMFSGMFTELAKWEFEERSIVVETVDDIDAMNYARQLRLAVRDIRTEAGRTKKKAKEFILIKERYIDGIYNSIESLCKMVETRALEKEQYVERLMEEKRQLVYKDRAAQLDVLEYNYANLDLVNMPDEIFQQTLVDATDLKAMRDKRKQDEELKQKAEQEARELEQQKNKLTATRLQELMLAGVSTTEDVGSMSEEQYILHKTTLLEIKTAQDLAIAQQREEAEKRKQRWNDRDRELEALGFSYDKYKGRIFISAYFDDEVNITNLQIDTLSDRAWNALVKKSITAITKLRKKDDDENQRRAKLQELRVARIAQVKLLDPRAVPAFIETDIEILDEDYWTSWYQDLKNQSDAIQQAEKTAEEKKRKESQSDLENVKEYFDTLYAIELPVLISNELTQMMIKQRESFLVVKANFIKLISKDLS